MLRHRLPLVASLLSLGAVGFACSGSNSGPSGGGATSTPAVFDIGGKDCHLVTSYQGAPFPGDERCITAPSTEAGMQFHYGPTNYNDPVEVSKYVLKPGEEVTACDYYYTPNTASVYFNAYHSRMRPGSHHMLLYIETPGAGGTGLGGALAGILGPSGPFKPTGNSGPTPNCNPGPGTRNLFGAQTPELDVDELTAGAAENNGLAVEIPPKQQMTIQAHFINATSAPILSEVWANILFTPPDQVTQLGEPIYFIGGAFVNLPMGQSQTVTGAALVPSDAAPDFRLIIGTGHYHSHTTEFRAYKSVNGVKEPLIHDYNTLGHAPDPTTWFFDSAKTNPVIDDVAKTGGAYSGIAHMQPGDKIEWECDWTNNDVPGGLKFGNFVYTAEMCNMFGLYAPSLGRSWQSVCPTDATTCLSL